MRSFRTQLVGGTVLLVAAVMVVLVGGTQAVLELTAHREINNAMYTRAQTALDILNESPTVQDADLEPGTRVYAASGKPLTGDLERATEARATELVAVALREHQTIVTDGPDDYHLRVTPYMLHGEQVVLVVTQDAEPFERSELYALVAMIVLAALGVALTAGASWRVSRKALAPVEQMAHRAAEWSEHDLSHRFALGAPTNELAALGETLDHLLDRVAQAIRSEQRLTSELAHELRTPLTAIRGSADVALMRAAASPDDPAVRDDLREIADATRRMETVITSLLSLARSPDGATGRSDVADAVARVAALVPSGVELTAQLPDDLPDVAAPEDLVVRALAPLVDNAAQHAAGTVTVTATVVPGGVEVSITDDGAGVADDVRDHVFEPGRSGAGGTGLGLGISRRVARSLGGDVELRDADRAEFVLTIPRA